MTPRQWTDDVTATFNHNTAWWLLKLPGCRPADAPSAPARITAEDLIAAWTWVEVGPDGILHPVTPTTAPPATADTRQPAHHPTPQG